MQSNFIHFQVSLDKNITLQKYGYHYYILHKKGSIDKLQKLKGQQSNNTFGWYLQLLCFAKWNQQGIFQTPFKHCQNGPDTGEGPGSSCCSEELFLRSKENTMPTPTLAPEPVAKLHTSQVTEWFQVSENQKRKQLLSNQKISHQVPAVKPERHRTPGWLWFWTHIHRKCEIPIYQPLQVRGRRAKCLRTGLRKAF